MRPSDEISGCRVSLTYRCDREWEDLTVTDDPGVRHCSGCDNAVHFCESPGLTWLHIARGECVCYVDKETELLGYLEPLPAVAAKKWFRTD